jgi:3-oxoacyl-[acyl-carrier-protein] synthase-3
MGYVIPDNVVTTTWLEEQIAPVYKALGIPGGYIERLTGIKERRWWDEGTLVSQASSWAGERALQNTGIAPSEVQCLINASVCRDYIEPATATFVHKNLGLPPTAMNFDMVNACLGFVNAMMVVANMIELGQIDTGLVVAAEDPREGQLSTVQNLLTNLPSKDALRDNLASFTLGAASVAMILRHKSKSKTGKRLLGGFFYGNTEFNQLCVAQPTWMRTDSSTLMREGAKVVIKAFESFKRELGWTDALIDKVFTHQVSEPQRIFSMYHILKLREGIDYPTLSYLGNTASVAAPISMALGVENGFVQEGDRICMMGVGSGINSIIAGIQW